MEGYSYKPRNSKDCWEPPEAGRGMEGFYPESQRQYSHADTLILDSRPSMCEKMNLFFFKPPGCVRLLEQPWETATKDETATTNRKASS